MIAYWGKSYTGNQIGYTESISKYEWPCIVIGFVGIGMYSRIAVYSSVTVLCHHTSKHLRSPHTLFSFSADSKSNLHPPRVVNRIDVQFSE